ncbi:MAG: hypothetical protein Q4E17_07165 [Synergistes sp.]|nr:hypothetical protein [Synergistes sp.]
MFGSLFYWIGTNFRIDLYLTSSKIAGILCSYADILAVAGFVRVMDIVRRRKPSKVRFAILAIFAAATPSLLVPKETLNFFIVQFIVLAPPYLILIWSAASEARHFVRYVKERLRD